MTQDSEGVHPIANTDNPKRIADIVFVHGLKGASHSTWRHGVEGKNGHFFWPEEFGKELAKCGIWTVGYPAGITAMGKPGMIIEKRAANLALQLANDGIGDRPLFFITHSMGGLVLKSLIVDSQTLPDEDRKRIVKQLKGIVFCGTPHRGSDFAKSAEILGAYFRSTVKLIMAAVAGLGGCALGALWGQLPADWGGVLGAAIGALVGGGVAGIQPHVKQMRANAEELTILHNQFIEWHRGQSVAIGCYAENMELYSARWQWRIFRLGIVVSDSSADHGIAGYKTIAVDDDHLTLVKPRNRKHPVYAGVRRLIHAELGRLTKSQTDTQPDANTIKNDLHPAAESAIKPVEPLVKSTTSRTTSAGVELTWMQCYQRFYNFVFNNHRRLLEPYEDAGRLTAMSGRMHPVWLEEDLRKLGIGDWSDLVLSGLGIGPEETRSPIWATAIGLRSLGFRTSTWKFPQEFLEHNFSLLLELKKTDQELFNRVVEDFELIPKASASPDDQRLACTIIISHNRPPKMSIRNFKAEPNVYRTLCFEGLDSFTRFFTETSPAVSFLRSRLSVERVVLEELDPQRITSESDKQKLFSVLQKQKLFKDLVAEKDSWRLFTHVYWDEPQIESKSRMVKALHSLHDFLSP